MPLDEKGRKKRAIKAATELAKIRKARTLERDKNIYLAYPSKQLNCSIGIRGITVWH
jgi:hypothetical protein